MLEIEQNTLNKCSLNEPFPSDQLNAQQEDGLHDDVVLEVDV